MDENIILFITNLSVFALCAGLYMIVPYLTRKSYLFGVKIPPEESSSPEAVKIKKSYITSCFAGIAILLIICIIQFIFFRGRTLLASLYLPLLILPVFLAAFIPGWKKAVRLKEEKGWAVYNILFAETNSSHSRGDLSALPFGWYIAGFIIMLFTFAAAAARYPALADTIPVHFNYNMEPDRWVNKSWMAVMQMPLFNLGLLVLMFLVGVSIEKAKLQLDPNNPRLSFAQHRVYRARMGHAIGFLTLVIIILITMTLFLCLFPEAAVWSLANRKFPLWCVIVLSLLAIIPIMVVTVKTGQGGCRVKIDMDGINDINTESTVSAKTKGRGDDKYWLLGMFYCNPDDPAVIVEARFGTKLSFNFAHLPVKAGVTLFFLLLVAMYVWLTITLL
ncbi:MAG: DUF1648 domain-containing protein [Treponema sp.]|nr:DUF1648 domain-containing protein [Treponema sp.]